MTELETITAFINSPAFALMSESVKAETYATQKKLAIAAIQQKIDEFVMPIIKENGLNLSVSIKETENLPEPKSEKTEPKEFSADAILSEYPDYEEMVVEKELDWSLFKHGFTVPRAFHYAVSNACSKDVTPGSNQRVTLLFNHKEYQAAVHNDKNGVMQFDFTKPLNEALQAEYSDTFTYMVTEKAKATNKKAMVKLPDHLKHNFVLCHCKQKDRFILVEKK